MRGLMYLGESLVIDGRTYPMTGIFPFSFSLEKKPQAHGYSIAEVRKANPFYPEGAVLKGHEFHYSHVINPEAASEFNAGNIYFAFGMKRERALQINWTACAIRMSLQRIRIPTPSERLSGQEG